MSIDLSKLTPAPWEVRADNEPNAVDSIGKRPFAFQLSDHGDKWRSAVCMGWENHEDMAFVALARNAFDVMMRRGWRFKYKNAHNHMRWEVVNAFGTDGRPIPDEYRIADDPFTALVEADKWYTEHVERKQ